MNDELKDLLRRINEARSAGDLQNVSDRLGDVLAITGDRSDILAARGNVMLSLGQESSAVDAAWRSIALDPTHDETLKLLGRLQVHSRQSGKELESLPGVPFAKYLMPLDYPPSRRLIPRWGYGRPAHSGLVELFDRNRAHFEKVITELRTLVPFFEKINPVYSQDTASEPGWIGPPVNAIDLALLYYFVWKYRPSTYLEIGSGSTTAFARRAVQDHALSTRIVSIDPEPRSGIDSICDAIIRDGLETLSDFEVFKNLKPGDIVFMDGSHRCFMNSDVTVFFLEVLPLLKPGVVVHIHDIVLPFDYPESFKEWYWNEQYVLAAYLLGMRDRVRILMPSQYVSGTPELRKSLKPQLLPNVGSGGTWLEGGSFWFTLV
jgi:predicted O-methyltransferase YrrM